MSGNLKIELNKEIIEKFKILRISSDYVASVLIVLFALQEDKIEILDTLDDDGLERRMLILYKQMQRRNLIYFTEGTYVLSDLGEEIVEFVRSKFENVHTEDLIFPVIQQLEETHANELTWVRDYINHFPKIKRDNPKVVSMRLKIFMKEFNYSPEIIVKAAYLYNRHHDKEQTPMQYRRKSQYLIFEGKGDGRTWDLATWCDKAIEEGQLPEQSNLDFFETL